MTEGSASSGLTGDPRDTTRAIRAREAVRDQGTAGINSSSYSINSINNNNNIHSRFSSNSSSSIPSIITEAVTAMLSPLMAMSSPCQLRTEQ